MTQIVKKPRKFGVNSKPNSKIETIDNGSNKWLNGISDQLSSPSLDEDIDVKAIPLNLINIDLTNPRELDIEPNDIISNIEILRLPSKAFNNIDSDWVEGYYEKINGLFGDSKKSSDLLNVAMFAASIKSPKNLINPITVWREETTFYLFAGERRYLAHLILEASHIVTRIWAEKPNPFDIRLLQWQENTQRENLSLHEKLINMKQILGEWNVLNPTQKMTVRKFGHILTMGKSQAGQYLRLVLTTNAALLVAIKANKIRVLDEACVLEGMSKDELHDYLENSENKSINNASDQNKQRTNESNKSEQNHDGKATSKYQLAIKVNKNANIKTISFIADALLKEIASTELNHLVEGYDLKNSKEMGSMLNTILEYLEAKNE